MIRILITVIALTTVLYSCSSNESKLMGKWKHTKTVNSGGKVIDSDLSNLKETTFEFFDRNKYTIQGFMMSNGAENLVTKTGEWKISEVKKDETSDKKTVVLKLREERIEGILEMKYTIDTLAKEEMEWSDSRNNKLYFSKISE